MEFLDVRLKAKASDSLVSSVEQPSVVSIRDQTYLEQAKLEEAELRQWQMETLEKTVVAALEEDNKQRQCLNPAAREVQVSTQAVTAAEIPASLFADDEGKLVGVRHS